MTPRGQPRCNKLEFLTNSEKSKPWHPSRMESKMKPCGLARSNLHMRIDGTVAVYVTRGAEVTNHVGVHELTGVECSIHHICFIFVVVPF